MPWRSHDGSVVLYHGDCRKVLADMPDNSVDFVFADPPYPYVKKTYGYWNEKQWRKLIDTVIEECRRILKPTGSMVLVLQPNSEQVGRVRPWLWRFVADWAERWNLVRDVYWWNYATLPTSGCEVRYGLPRASLKHLVWLGPADCYRDQGAVLWKPSDDTLARKMEERRRGRTGSKQHLSGAHVNVETIYNQMGHRGGVTPFNVLPITNTDATNSSGSWKHPAGTPLDLVLWWLRYCCPEGGLGLDPFLGAGTTALAAMQLCRRAIGIEIVEEYYNTAVLRAKAAGAFSADDAEETPGSGANDQMQGRLW
jgi:DNA modification methylase